MISAVAVTFFFLVILIVYRKKSAIKNLKKISLFQEQIEKFSSELDSLLNQIVDKEQEGEFIAKWQHLYSEIGRCKIPKKNAAFSEIRQFKETYKNLRKIIFQSNAEIKRKEELKNLAQKVSVFFNEFFQITENYVAHSAELQFIKNWEPVFFLVNQADVHNEDEEFSDIERFKTVFNSMHDYFENANQQFIKSESLKYDELFSNIDGKNLDFQQRTAVITDEDRVLVLAGAGSGKTLTIAAKVKYLCEVKNINPNEILLVSFAKKSAQEMTERIQNKLGVNVEATTFHKLGLEVIKNTTGRRPEVSDEKALSDFVHNFFENELLNHPELIKNLTEYFTYFLEIPENMEDYSSLGELYDEEKTADLETLKSKYDREKYIRKTGVERLKALRTLNNEQVKSIEETKIANFLFMHGIRYEYEKLYPFESENPKRKAYRPDFYLCDYDIYLEHFGVSKNFTVPWLSPIEEKKYLDGILWKRDWHKKNGTKLIETYSYYSSEGILLKKLEELLVENNIEFKTHDFTDIFNTVYASKSNKYFGEFIKLCCTFITLFKSNNYKIEEIENLRQKYLAEEKNEFLCERTNLFLDIIKILLSEYQNYLSENNAIDFSDMINNAADMLSGACNFPLYKYVIVDEYQDISKSRFNFLRAIADKTGAKFLCVGDDWQSIYRFAGNDISLFTDFEKYFGYTKILRIEKTYRNSQQLIDVASNFVLKNPMQLKKNLHSDKSLDYPLVFWGFDDDPRKSLQQMINKIVLDFGVNSSILLLGRTNQDVEIAKKTGLFKTYHQNRKEKLEYIPVPELQIDFMSVHKSKGLEADNVILLNFKNDKLGFPNQIADDKVLNLVLTNAEDFKFAEERRLFYVAITRTKNRTFILTDNRNPSPFFKEFTASNSVCFLCVRQTSKEGLEKCPLCKTGNLLKVEHNGKTFAGCSNFPRCKYTINDVNVLSNPKKCPACGGFLVKRKGKKNNHWFIGCTNYPYCEYTEELKILPT